MNRRTFIARATALLAVGGSVQAGLRNADNVNTVDLNDGMIKFDGPECRVIRNQCEYTAITRDMNAAPTHKLTRTESGWIVEKDNRIVFEPDI